MPYIKREQKKEARLLTTASGGLRRAERAVVKQMDRDLELKTTPSALSHLLTVSLSPWGLIEQLMNN